MTVITSAQCFEDVPCRINVSGRWLQKGEGEGHGSEEVAVPKPGVGPWEGQALTEQL